jgi:hypothetical protein
MHRMPFVPPAVSFQFDACRVVLFVLLGRIVAVLALGALERNDHAIFFLCHYADTLVITPEPTV